MISAKQIFLGRASRPPLPYDAEVDYLESTGSAGYIDTGLQIDDNYYECRVDFQQMAKADSQWAGVISQYTITVEDE